LYLQEIDVHKSVFLSF